MRNSKWIVGFMLLGAMCAFVWAQQQPAQPVDAAAPAEEKKPAVVSPAAKAVLDDIQSAYSKLKTLDVSGSLAMNLDAAGEKANDKGEFAASFSAPAKFRHEMKDDLLLVSNGEKAFLYKTDEKKYITVDAIKDRADVADMPAPVGAELGQQNPSLLLALSKDAAAGLTDGMQTVDRGDDVVIEGTSFQQLKLKSEGQMMQVLVNPKTHLIRQVTVDVKERLLKRGIPEVKSAEWTVNYAKTSADASMVETAFDWTPPSDATQVKLPNESAGASGDENAPSMAMVGKPAPDFNLKDLSGEAMTLAAQKGKVVVLDFWATWCPPCVEGMPHLDALAKEMAPKGVKVFAVNLRETKAQAQKFIEDKKLKVSVLLDTDGAVGDSYKVTGIPQTVVIGKDGLVAKVFIGFGPGSEDKLKAAVEEALK